ncbi:unnamed protein product [Oppiella nova]|uniref:Protein TEX261 n=1 Tax=Oppiella nova TaxID=334625 RepID=A0A7R9QDU7_9ACAR|nr:unnamed protein product [Oppiella nova]CAG2163340.1 unnamed protein product [Oppiella nova]
MWFLVILSWFALLVQLFLVVLSVAAGLYYLAELVEEFSVISAKVIKSMILVLAFFTICLWLIPFAFFISLSANENVLPTIAETKPLLSDESDVVSHYFSRRGKRYGLLSFFNYAKDSLLPQRVKKSF